MAIRQEAEGGVGDRLGTVMAESQLAGGAYGGASGVVRRFRGMGAAQKNQTASNGCAVIQWHSFHAAKDSECC